jgi:hypothetical protein
LARVDLADRAAGNCCSTIDLRSDGHVPRVRRGDGTTRLRERGATHIPVPPPGLVASKSALCSRPHVFIQVCGVTHGRFWLAAPMKPDSTAMLRW